MSEDRSAYQEGDRRAHERDFDAAHDAYGRADEEGHGTAAVYAGVLAEARGEHAGETFSPNPQTGPKLPYNPTNP